MKLFLLTLLFLAFALAAMAVGVIFSNRKLKGSCGGLGAIMGEDCQICDKKDECPDSKAQSGGPLKIDPSSGEVSL